MTTYIVLGYLLIGFGLAFYLWRHRFSDNSYDSDFTLSFVLWTLLFWPVVGAILLYMKFFKKGEGDERSGS